VRVTHTSQQDTNKTPLCDMHAKALTGHKIFMHCACTSQQDTNKTPLCDMHAKALTGHKMFMHCACSGAMAPDAYSGASHAAS
jgi:hypothetical protein